MKIQITNIQFILAALGVILVTLAVSFVKIGVIKIPKTVSPTSHTFWIFIVTAMLIVSTFLLTR